MSYARKGEDGSEVTVTLSLHCEDCALETATEGSAHLLELCPDLKFGWVANTPADMVAHLLAHRDEGHTVPQDAIDRLIAEASQSGQVTTKAGLRPATDADWREFRDGKDK